MKIIKISQSKGDIYKSIRKTVPKPGRSFDDGPEYVRTKSNYEDEFGSEIDMDSLKHDATVCVELRGHTLGNWEDSSTSNRNISHNTCTKCGREVTVIDKPLPNQIDIGGEAVSMNCDDIHII